MGDRPAKLNEKKRKTNLSEVREHAVANITLVFSSLRCVSSVSGGLNIFSKVQRF